MKPSALQYLLARDVRWFTFGTSAILTGICARALCPDFAFLLDPGFLGWFVCALVLLWPLFLFVGAMYVLPCCMVLSHRLNGAPFQIGETVQILTKRHRDRLAWVYEVRPDRKQVRVDLGVEEKNARTDVFHYTEVCRSEEKPS